MFFFCGERKHFFSDHVNIIFENEKSWMFLLYSLDWSGKRNVKD